MTASIVEYSLMAGNAYESTRTDVNRIPFPAGSGWARLGGGLDSRVDDVTGFEAKAFQRGTAFHEAARER
jgi:3-dehydroquinate synthetase